MSGDRGFNDFPDTEMSAHVFSDECEETRNDDDEKHIVEFDEEKSCQAFTRLFCTDDLPLRIIESPNFQSFMLSLNPTLQFGTFESLKGNCLKFYDEEKVKVKKILKNLDRKISLSVEIWKSPTECKYMCLMAHFIDDKWKFKKWVLRFHILSVNTLPEAICKSLSIWDIEDMISTITLKSGSYNDETVEMVKDHIQKKKQLQLNGQLFHVYCCADLFNLMVQDAFDEISTTIDKVHELISWGNSEPVWYLTVSRLKEALDLQSAGEFSSKRVRDNYDVPSADEWKNIEAICKLVEVIHNVARLLFETKYPTACIFLGNIRELRGSLTRGASNSDSFINAVVEKMLQKLDKYWKDMFLVLAVATVMDPRCKMNYIEFLSSKIEGNDDNSRVATVLEAIRGLYASYPTRILENECTISCNSEEEASDFEEHAFGPEEVAILSEKRKEKEVPGCVEQGSSNPNDCSSHLEGYQQFVQSSSGPSKSELDWYLEEPVLPWSQDFKLLNWWRDASPKYPTLSRMARDLLSIPLSVLTSSDAYYTEERKIDRRLLTSGLAAMNALMCTRSWLRKC